MPVEVDGNDPDVIYATAVAAVGRARSGAGPSLIEAVSYRHGGHSGQTPASTAPTKKWRPGWQKTPCLVTANAW